MMWRPTPACSRRQALGFRGLALLTSTRRG
jgi:hypothetical protein